jgi:WD40 repeat protein
VWDIAKARVQREFRSEKAAYVAVFSPDGQRVLIGSADRTARVRDLRTGQQTSEIMRHPGGVWYAEYSPDGRIVVTGDDKGAARCWDARSGLPLGNWLQSQDTLKQVRLSSQGHRVITASRDGTVRIWPVVTAPSPPPAWLPDLAEALAGRRLDPEGNLQAVPFENWQSLRDRLIADDANTFYARWARWFLVDRLEKETSPFGVEP